MFQEFITKNDLLLKWSYYHVENYIVGIKIWLKLASQLWQICSGKELKASSIKDTWILLFCFLFV